MNFPQGIPNLAGANYDSVWKSVIGPIFSLPSTFQYPTQPDLSIWNFMSSAVSEIQEYSRKCFNYFVPQDVHQMEDAKSFHIDVDMPGVKKTDISVDTVGNEISITAKRFCPPYEGECTTPLKEYSHKFNLPESADMNAVKAKCEDGVLYVTFAKKPESTPEKKKVVVS